MGWYTRLYIADVAFCFFALTADLIYCRFHVQAKLLLIARKYSTRAEFPSAWRSISSSRGYLCSFWNQGFWYIVIHLKKSLIVLIYERGKGRREGGRGALSHRGEKQRFDKYSRWIVHIRSRTRKYCVELFINSLRNFTPCSLFVT